jgi:hypothetical protein
MPFEKGIGSKIYKNVGRKGYEYEKAQLEEMRKVFNKDLKIASKFQEAKEFNPLEEKKLQVLSSRALKYADKLHASKSETDITSKGEKIDGINYIVPKDADNYSTDVKTTSS